MYKLFLFSFLLLLVCCTDTNTDQSSISEKQHISRGALELEQELELEPSRTAEPQSPDQEYRLEKGSKIIKTGRMDFEVSNLKQSKLRIDSLITHYQSYYENEQYNSYGNRISYTLKIRIPNEKFDSLLFDLENGFGKLTSKNVNAKDVTEEYVDLKIRLENNLGYLNQYKEILKKAKSIKEILEVQEKIRRIEEEIESKKGRLQFLDNKVKYSTLNLNISEMISRKLTNQPTFGKRIANAFKNGIEGFLNFLVAMVNLWPLLIFIILIFLFRKRLSQLIKRK